MAEQDNYWDDAAKVWRDRATGNWMKPVDQGGDGVWHFANQEQQYTAQFSRRPGDVATDPGYGFQLNAQQGSIQQAQSQLEAKLKADAAAVQNAYDAHKQQVDAALQIQLQQGRITSAEFQQQRTLAQQEAEFARTFALNQLSEQHNTQLNALKLAGDQQLQQANLAANPKDFVAYQYFMRNQAAPSPTSTTGTHDVASAAWDLAQKAATPSGGQTQAGSLVAPTTPQVSMAPGYSDSALQGLVSGITGNAGSALYNPNLGGTGAFGANVPTPNSVSRSTWNATDPTSRGILESFLNAGVSNGQGQRFGIDPSDWQAQLMRSFIPTLSGSNNLGQYSTGFGY